MDSSALVTCKDDYVYIQCDPYIRSKLDFVPGKIWLPNKQTLKAIKTPYTIKRIMQSLAKELPVEYFQYDEEFFDIYKKLVTNESYKRNNMFYNCGDIPNSKSPTWKHQRIGYHMLEQMPSLLFNWGMGSGKTRPIVQYVHNHQEYKNVLILCPLVVVQVWKEQFEKHAEVTKGMLFLDTDTIKERAKRIQCSQKEGKTVVVLNYDTIINGNMYSILTSTKWDMIILDESHRIKSAGSKRSLILYSMSKGVTKKVCLSGTPCSNSILDVYGQYRFLDCGIFGTNSDKFENEYANYNRFNEHVIDSYKNLDKFYELFNTIAYSVDVDDVIELPESQDLFYKIDMPSDVKQVYTSIKNKQYAFVGGKEVIVQNPLTKILRLRQLASGYVPCEGGTIEHFSNNRQKLLSEVIGDINVNEPIVIYTNFVEDMKSVREVCTSLHRSCSELSGAKHEYAPWKEQKTNVLIAQIQSGSEGIDCTRARYCIYYSMVDNIKDYFQSKRRLKRQGQKRNMKFIHLFMNGSLDSKMYISLINNKNFIDEVLSGNIEL